MSHWLELVLTIMGSVLASSGFWAFIQKRRNSNVAERELLIGLAHDRIMYLGGKYIERGWCTQDEYENLKVYLYDPYFKAGGNGSAERTMKDVERRVEVLTIHEAAERMIQNETERQDV